MIKNLLVALLLISTSAQGALVEGDRAIVDQVKNIVENPGFESGKASWTASGGTALANSTAKAFGALGYSWDSNAAAQTVTGKQITIPEGLKGQNAILSCLFKAASGTATHKLQVFDGTSVKAESVIASTTSVFSRTVVNFVAPSSGTLAPRIISVAANEPTLYFDNCELGYAYNIGNISQTTEWKTDWTPTITGIGGGSGISFIYRFNADMFEAQGNFTVTSASATAFTISLPAGVTVGSSVPSKSYIGFATREPNGGKFSVLAAAPGDSTVGLSDTSGATALTVTNANNIVTAADVVSVKFSMKVGGVSPNAVYNSSTAAASWLGYQTVASGWAQTSSTFAAPSAGTTIVTTQLDARNILCTSDGTNAGIECSLPRAGKYRVCPSVSYAASVDSQHGWRIVDGSANILYQGSNTYVANGALTNITFCGYYNASSPGLAQFRIHNATNGGTITIQDGAAATTPAMNWLVEQSDVALPAPVLIGSVTSGSTGPERIERLRITNSGTPTIASQSGSWVSSLTDNATGDTTIVIPAGVFSAAPTCTCTVEDTGDTHICRINTNTPVSATAVRIQTTNDAASAVDRDTAVICIGPR